MMRVGYFDTRAKTLEAYSWNADNRAAIAPNARGDLGSMALFVF